MARGESEAIAPAEGEQTTAPTAVHPHFRRARSPAFLSLPSASAGATCVSVHRTLMEVGMSNPLGKSAAWQSASTSSARADDPAAAATRPVNGFDVAERRLRSMAEDEEERWTTIRAIGERMSRFEPASCLCLRLAEKS